MSEGQDAEAELRNPFPSPPKHYTNYTSHNLALLKLLNQRSDPTSETQSQQDILADQTDIPQWSLKQLEKPRVDWILEDGYYNVFGEIWYVSVDVFSDRSGL
jgi:mediator of RNA polymerase II transcription subunit 7